MIDCFTDVEDFLGDQESGQGSCVLAPVEDRGRMKATAVESPGDVLAWFSLSLAWWHPERGSDPLAHLSLAGMAEGPAGGVAARWM